jgi:hypothetical protein
MEFVFCRFQRTSLHVYLILQDGHEICFVDEEGFCKLSEFDPEGEKLLDRYIAKDKSRD